MNREQMIAWLALEGWALRVLEHKYLQAVTPDQRWVICVKDDRAYLFPRSDLWKAFTVPQDLSWDSVDQAMLTCVYTSAEKCP